MVMPRQIFTHKRTLLNASEKHKLRHGMYQVVISRQPAFLQYHQVFNNQSLALLNSLKLSIVFNELFYEFTFLGSNKMPQQLV